MDEIYNSIFQFWRHKFKSLSKKTFVKIEFLGKKFDFMNSVRTFNMAWIKQTTGKLQVTLAAL